MARARNWCFTLNNPSAAETQRVCSTQCTYIVVGREVGEAGTPHLQGYVQFAGQIRLAAVKLALGCDRLHLEVARGTPAQASEYCKKDGDFTEAGVMRGPPGRRSDLVRCRDAARAGASLRDLLGDPDWVPTESALKVYSRVVGVFQPLSERPVRVFWFHGPTGSGKSRTARDACDRDDTWVSGCRLDWFDGYDGQAYALIDDFRPKDVTFSWLLRLLDRYDVRVPVKGSFTTWRPRFIFITCPRSPTDAYGHLVDAEDLAQLERRIERVVAFPLLGPFLLDVPPAPVPAAPAPLPPHPGPPPIPVAAVPGFVIPDFADVVDLE